MTENPKLVDMASENLSSASEAYELEDMGAQKICVSNQINSLQYTSMKSDSFIVDIDSFSHHTDKDQTANSRINLQRSLSRKGSHRAGEKKTNYSAGSERDNSVFSISSSRAALDGASSSTPEKSMVVTVGATEHAVNPQVHDQISIKTGNIGTTTAESRFGSSKRSSFRRSSRSWAIDPRRMFFFFASLSSMGTILLIYFTLSMGKFSGDDNSLNW